MELRQDGILALTSHDKAPADTLSRRESGIELLRILAMLAIVMEHFITQSPLTDTTIDLHRILNTFLGSGARICVNIFVFIGAWFMVDSRFKAERPIRLYLEVVFYSIPLTLTMLAIGQHGGTRQVIQGMIPFFGRSVWFASAYISLVALSPFLNHVFALPAKRQTLLMGLLFTLYCIVATIPSSTPLDYIADFTWFCIAYLLVGWAKHSSLIDRIHIKWAALVGGLGIYAALCLISLSPRLQWIGRYWLDNIKSLPNAACALMLFVFFLKVKIGSVRTINLIARSVFAVYIVHQVPAFHNFEWNTILKFCDISTMAPTLYAFSIISVAGCIFAIVSILDWLRIRFAEPFYMKLGVVQRGIQALERAYAENEVSC